MKLLNNNYFQFVLGIIIVCFILFPFRNCIKKNKVDLNKDSLIKYEVVVNDKIVQAIKENERLKIINDSLLHLKPKLVIRYKTKYDSLITTDTQCVKSLNLLHNVFTDLNKLNDSIINTYKQRASTDSVLVSALSDKIILKQRRINIDSMKINILTDSIPKIKRKGFIKGFKYGFGSGCLITQGLNTGASLFLK